MSAEPVMSTVAAELVARATTATKFLVPSRFKTPPSTTATSSTVKVAREVSFDSARTFTFTV